MIKESASELEAKFSLAFCAALALVRGEAGEREFTDAALTDARLRALAARVRLTADGSLGACRGNHGNGRPARRAYR